MNIDNEKRNIRKEIWRRALVNLTAGADTRDVVYKSLGLSLAAILFTSPYFYYLLAVIPNESEIPLDQNLWTFLIIELVMLFIILFLCSVIGLSFSERYALPGLGDFKKFLKSIPILFVVGAIMIALSFIFFDRFYFQISPQSYPAEFKYLFTLPFKSALTDEIILRLGLTTIAVGLLRSKGAGVVLVAALTSYFIIKYNHFIGIDIEFDYLFISQLAISFIANLLLGYLFVNYGLLYTMGLKFIFGLKYIVVILLLGTAFGGSI